MIKILEDIFSLRSSYRSFGDYSATSLIDSPRRVQLYKRYSDQEVVTPKTQFASMVGQAIHKEITDRLKIYSQTNGEYIVEAHIVHPITLNFPETTTEGGILLPKKNTVVRLLSGQFDILHKERALHDIKTCKTWKVIFDPDKIEWTQQLNIYRWILSKKGITVEELYIDALFMDWQEGRTFQDARYPKTPQVEYPINVWPLEQTESFIKERLAMHIGNEGRSDAELAACTKEEMWENDTEYGIFKDEQAKRATKVVKEGSLMDAISVARNLKGVGPDGYIELRHGQRKRCDEWCGVNKFCNLYSEYCAGKDAAGNLRREKYPLKEVL